jgi:YD repeat-containing protein
MSQQIQVKNAITNTLSLGPETDGRQPYRIRCSIDTHNPSGTASIAGPNHTRFYLHNSQKCYTNLAADWSTLLFLTALPIKSMAPDNSHGNRIGNRLSRLGFLHNIEHIDKQPIYQGSTNVSPVDNPLRRHGYSRRSNHWSRLIIHSKPVQIIEKKCSSYDANSRLTSQTDSKGNTTTLAYDGLGHLAPSTEWAGRVTAYQYDNNGRLILTSRPDGTQETRSYDGSGMLISINDTAPWGTTYANSITIEAAARTAAENETMPVQPFTAPAGVSATYDADNRLATVNGTYGPYGELNNHTGSSTTPFQYNGQFGVQTDPNGLLYMLAAMVNTKCSPKWLAKPYTFLLFTVSWGITWVSYSKIESDLSDKRLEQIGAAHSPGRGFGVLLVVGALLLFMIAVVYLLTQWIYQSVAECKKKS